MISRRQRRLLLFPLCCAAAAPAAYADKSADFYEGYVRVGPAADPCDAGSEGGIRYNVGVLEYCNGTAWTGLLTGAAGIPAAPDRSIQFNTGGVLGGSSNLVYTSAGNLGIGTSTPTTEFMAVGTFGSGSTLSTAGAGTRMLWYPRKAAFRAGYVSGTQWDDATSAITASPLVKARGPAVPPALRGGRAL